MTKTTVLSTDHIRVTCYNAERTRLVVAFDHWRSDRDGFPPEQTSEFFARSGVAFMTVQSARNDWFLSPHLQELRRALREFTPRFQRVNAIGFSMGGYGALLLARALKANQVLLVSPQSSIFPQRVPFETRYLREAAELDPALDDLADKPRRGLRGVVLFDSSSQTDTRHKNILTGLFPNLTAVALPFGGHPALQAVAEARLYRKVQEEMLRPRIRPGALLGLHKTARKGSDTYRAGLAGYLHNRAERL